MQTAALLALIALTWSASRGSIFRNEKVQTAFLLQHMSAYMIFYGVYFIHRDLKMLMIVALGIGFFALDTSNSNTMSAAFRKVVVWMLRASTATLCIHYILSF